VSVIIVAGGSSFLRKNLSFSTKLLIYTRRDDVANLVHRFATFFLILQRKINQSDAQYFSSNDFHEL